MDGQQYAEKPQNGEQWHEMILRQQREGNKENGYLRERLRSLPEEQKEKERGDLNTSLLADEAFDKLIREASQRAIPDRSIEMER